MKKIVKLLPLLLVASLTACDSIYIDTVFCFDTVVNFKFTSSAGYSGNATENQIKKILKDYDALLDSYNKRDVFNVFDLNQTNEKVEISAELYNVLHEAMTLASNNFYFHPLIGSLSQKWKGALAKNEVLSDTVIQEELDKISESRLIIEESEDHYYAQRVGSALIDLGAMAKGYALDKIQDYISAFTDNYLFDAGSSSVLIGQNSSKKDKTYKIKIKDLSKGNYLYLSDSFISTSGTSEQATVIDGVKYSHIINPYTGSAVPQYDAVIVTSSNDVGNGALLDAMSTSLMMNTLEEIAEIDKNQPVNIIVIKDDKVIYKSDDITLHNK